MNDVATPFERVRHAPGFRLGEVVSAEALTPKMRRIRLQSPDLAGFRSEAFDDHIRLFFPPPGTELGKPAMDGGRFRFPQDRASPVGRDYTPRRFEPGENILTIDFVLHGHGPASGWAARARPGDRLGIVGPPSSLVIRFVPDWHLFVGDETALPSIARRLEELPESARALAIVEIADAAERLPLESRAKIDIRWIERNGVEPGTGTAILDTVTGTEFPAGRALAFVATETTMARAVRRHLVNERGFRDDLVRAYRFWQRGAPDLGNS